MAARSAVQSARVGGRRRPAPAIGRRAIEDGGGATAMIGEPGDGGR